MVRLNDSYFGTNTQKKVYIENVPKSGHFLYIL
jgi:hypothetical protein